MKSLSVLALILFSLTTLTSAADDLASSRRPNILFIFSDDHATQALGAYGSKFARTPHLDRLAEQGMRFEYCFCTNSICGPSRAVVLTGKYSHLNGFAKNSSKFDGSQQTFPKLLQKAGYQTAIVGKWHLVTDPTGFDFWEVLPGQGEYYNPDFLTPKGKLKRSGYVSDVITERAVEWLQTGRDKSKPFVLMCQHKAPHRNWQPSARHLHMFDDVIFPEPPTLLDDYKNRASGAAETEMTIATHMSLDSDLKVKPQTGEPKAWDRMTGRLDPEQRKTWEAAYLKRSEAFHRAKPAGDDLIRWKYQEYMKDYMGCIAGVDDSVGRLMKHLDESGLADNTVVIYSSDQGFYLGEHGWYDKRWMYEESLRMPLIVRWPNKVRPGSVNRQMVSNLDFAETFLEIAGVPVPEDMQGQSMVPMLAGETPADWRKSFYYRYYEYPKPHKVPPHYGVRTERHKLIYYPRTDEWELFDLEKDPHEIRSVYAEAAYAETVKELKAELARLREQYKDHEG